MWILLIVIASSIWVYFDARNIGVRKGLITGFFDMGPFTWALCSLLFWIIGFPAYLIKRSELINTAKNKSHHNQSATHQSVRQSGLNITAKFIAIIWTILFVVLCITYANELSKMSSSGIDDEYFSMGAAIGATMGYGLYFFIWAIVTIPATIIYFITRRSEPTIIIEHRPDLPQNNTGQKETETKSCPFCAEKINLAAVYCRFCNKDLEVKINSETQTPPASHKTPAHTPAKTPNQARDWIIAAKTYLKEEKYKEAVIAATNAIEKEATGENYYLRAVIYSKISDRKRMTDDLKTASEKGNERATSALGKLTGAS